MLNFRKLKKDFSPAILREGQGLYKEGMIQSAKIARMDGETVTLSCRVAGKFDNTYECEIAIDRRESMIVESDCNCTYQYDCQHLAGILFYLEDHLDKLLVAFSKEADLEDNGAIDEEEKKSLRKTFEQAKTKEVARKDKALERELIEEYTRSSSVLGHSPFFLPEERLAQDKAELAIVLHEPEQSAVPIQLALRLPYRSKPLNVPNIKDFLEAVRYDETLYIGSKRYYFTMSSFDLESAQLLRLLLDFVRCPEEANPRLGELDFEALGTLLARAYDMAVSRTGGSLAHTESGSDHLPYLFYGHLEEPFCFSRSPTKLRFSIDYFETPAPKILLTPKLLLPDHQELSLKDVALLECARPGMVVEKTYYRFAPNISRKHLRHLTIIGDIAIPEPLFGTFLENSLPELRRFAELSNSEAIDHFVTLPFTGQLKGECHISYLEGELEAELFFLYDQIKVPAASSQLKAGEISAFVTPEGILARNLTEEKQLIEDLFQDFFYNSKQGVFQAKNDKKIVEFMTEVIPRHQEQISFHCPENLLDRFIYDETHFTLHLKESDHVGHYLVSLKVDGHLRGTSTELLWECLALKRCFIELSGQKLKKGGKGRGRAKQETSHKILILDLERIAPVLQLFDEIGLTELDDYIEERPLWSLTSIGPDTFKGMPVRFTMSKRLQEIQKQMLGQVVMEPTSVPEEIQATPRSYQLEGIHWLERLRNMHLNGILADDMGLGKTLQAIVAISQYQAKEPDALSLVVCPTSLIYNWEGEFAKFAPDLKVLPIDGTPAQRQRLIRKGKKYQVFITSYTLLQKDIETYKKIPFTYVILDEAQYIKNRATRNAKSVKQLTSAHKLILTGTPVENSLEDLWSLFDFLMPGLLSSYDRFIDKYIRSPQQGGSKQYLEMLRQKLSPFILRRMKKDVLKDLPPVSEIVYHCHLSETQRALYRSYAESARRELSDMVKRDGFDRIQIHVLATLTRLKQICCHPAIFAKENPEENDSAKYEMLKDLLQSLIEGQHKAVIFSQYTRMLQIIRGDLERQGIPFSYLDGTTKDRLGVVKQFNEDRSIPLFLVSLKAGGSGLNLVGADTVIHYDIWWNPAVENQATDRVHRIGQQQAVSAYKLVTKGTIEEKIIELQDRKRGLVKGVISSDDEALSKLTWEEVLELLKT